MRTFICDCGEEIKVDYLNQTTLVRAEENVFVWSCLKCGQSWYEKVKEPKEIPDASC